MDFWATRFGFIIYKIIIHSIYLCLNMLIVSFSIHWICFHSLSKFILKLG